MTQITCRDLTIGYGSRIILKHLNFTVNEGDYLCIIGENGSGKSSLMRTILNLQNPINGQILYDHQIQQNGIGYLPQQTSRQKDFLHPFVKSSFPDVTDAAAFILFIMLLIKRRLSLPCSN